MKTFDLHRTLALALITLSSVAMIRPAVAQGVELTDDELAIWNDPEFRQRFVESYLAPNDTEPKPASQEEIDAINATLELMRNNDLEGALAKAIEARDNPQPKATKKKSSKEEDKPEVRFSALMDYLIANLQLNIALNLPEPGEDATEQEQYSYTVKRNKYLADAGQGYRTVAAKHPKYINAWRNLAIVYLRMSDYRGAREALAKLIGLGGAGADLYGQLAYCHTVLGDHLAAESAYRMANLMQPENQEWKMRLIRNFQYQQRHHEVVAMTTSLLDQDPTNDMLWLLQANAYIGLGLPAKAAENYEILDGLGKSTPQIVSLLGDIYTNDGLFNTALQRYTKALEMTEEDKRPAMLPKLIGATEVFSNRGEEAREATKAMIVLIDQHFKADLQEKDQTKLLRIGARIALAEGADDEQAAILKEVVAIDPLDGEALILLGQHHARLQEWDAAINYYERAEKLDKFEADALVYHAYALVMSDRAAQALPLLRKAQQLKPRERVQTYLETVERMKK